jgi:acetyltransferase-like isoleucine patch superfamily enzyme
MDKSLLESGRPSKRFSSWKRPTTAHGRLNEYNWIVMYPEGLSLADYVDVGAFTFMQAKSGIVIEKDVQIGSHCSIYSESTIDGRKGRVTLKENCRIGTHSSIMPGVTIGKGAVIGAHSFVTKDVPDSQVWAGVPDRRIDKP